MFDLLANVNGATPEGIAWTISLPIGRYHVTYNYHVDRVTDWYDFLAKRSRFAGITPIWRGTETSNTIEVDIVS